MTAHILIEVVGWIGATLILAGYGLLTAGKLTSKDPAYQVMNVVGATGFIINSAWNGAWPSAILNVIWVGIGAVALIRMAIRARTPTTAE